MTKNRRKLPVVLLILLIIGLSLCIVLFFGARRYFPLPYKTLIHELSEETGVSESLIYAVIHTESGFRSEAESHLGARGLMQLTEETFDWVKYRQQDSLALYDDLFVPETNIKYGTWLLGLLKQEFITQTAVLSAYHAGWGSVSKWLENKEYSADGKTISKIPFRDTAYYVHKVERTQKIYQFLYQLS